MDVKSISNIQSSIEMNVQNMQSMQSSKSEKSALNRGNTEKNDIRNVSPEMLEELVKELEKKLTMLNTQLKISIDKDTDIVVVKVIDKETKKVIRQIPPEYVLKIAKYLDEIAGLLYNNRV